MLKNNFIYIETSAQLSKKGCEILRAIALCRGVITCGFNIHKPKTEKELSTTTMHFKVRFDCAEDKWATRLPSPKPLKLIPVKSVEEKSKKSTCSSTTS